MEQNYEYELLLVEAGFKPKGAYTEMHEKMLIVAKFGQNINDPLARQAILDHLDRVLLRNCEDVHIDGWVVINQVHDHSIYPTPKSSGLAVPHPGGLEPIFTNLGGYKINTQGERHFSKVIFAPDVDAAKPIALQREPFCMKVHNIPGAPAHVDDRGTLGSADVDDTEKVSAMLPDWDFIIQPNAFEPDSVYTWNVTGYYAIRKNGKLVEH